MDLALGDTRLIIDACQSRGVLRNQAAYVLATAYHESAHTMKPIAEYGSRTYLESKPYWPFIGRGYVQLTWKANYQKASERLGVDFVTNPSLLLQAQYAAPILVLGMIEGWFTGKKLADYIDLQHSDFVGARHIINGIDRANLIALYATQYDTLLKDGYGLSADAPASPAPAAPPPAPVPQPAPPAAPGPPVAAPQPKPSVAIPATVAGALALAASIWWHEIVAWFHHLLP